MKHAGFLTIIKLLGLDKRGRMWSGDANKAQSKLATHVSLASVSYRRRAFLPTEALWLLGVRTQAPFNCKPLKGCRSPEKHGRPKQCEPASPGLVRPHEDGQPPPLLQPPGGKRWRPKRASPPAQQATWGLGGRCEGHSPWGWEPPSKQAAHGWLRPASLRPHCFPEIWGQKSQPF